MEFKQIEFRSAREALDIYSIFRMKRDQYRKMYREIEKDEQLLDWNTKGECLLELVELGMDMNQMMESILQNMTLQVYPFKILDRRA